MKVNNTLKHNAGLLLSAKKNYRPLLCIYKVSELYCICHLDLCLYFFERR